MAVAQPENPDYHYLSIRCMEDELEKNRAFIRGHDKFPQHSWLAFAAAYSFAEIEEWQKSYYTASTNNAALRANIGLDAERVSRVLKEKLKIDVPARKRVTNDDINA